MKSDERTCLGPRGFVANEELVRVVIQFLYSLGYKESAALLENESKISYKSSQFVMLESQILAGKWEESINTVCKLKDVKDEDTRVKAVSLILEQCVSEFLSKGDDTLALKAVRKDFSTLRVGKEKIHNLCSLVIAKDINRLGELEDGVIGEMRLNLLSNLERVLPPPIVVPERRLEKLIEMVLYSQTAFCLYHNTLDPISLFEDHSCAKDDLPTETVQILRGHTHEVLFVQFSNNGEYLASSSRDCTAIIWKVPEHGSLTLKHTLRGHQGPVLFASWSPNDKMLLTVETEILKLWDVETGACKRSIREHTPICRSCAWFPDSEWLVFGSNKPSPDGCVYKYKFDEDIIVHMTEMDLPELIDLAILPNGESAIYIFPRGISIQNFNDYDGRFIFEQSAITSVSVSREGRFLLVNLVNQEIHVWDVAGKNTQPLIYVGHKQTKFAIRSCFGGVSPMFLASGSEDSQVYIWHAHTGNPIKVLSGHSMVVNCVSWNPKQIQILASASDDRTIRIWKPPGSDKNIA
ncbi:WD repeat-containing protein WDS homolog [Malania oleifera]|uniref:WD repeat-containing protein WDS homolog n=1 Tax=Malania oleifera TaxID=397392 RepID=UPI0025ADCF09|nr:WD repeat-containing protein WDS homolog [Malania oleifera]